MFGFLPIATIFFGLAAAMNNFPDFLLEKEKTFNEINTPIGHLITAPLEIGEMPCQMDVKVVERVIGKCERRGGSEACIAGSYIVPNHHDCVMNRQI